VGSASEIYVAASDGLWRRTGTSWTRFSGLPTDDINAVVIDRSQNPDVVYFGTASMGVFASFDGGQAWEAVNEGLGNLSIIELAIDNYPILTLHAGTKYGGVWSMRIGEALRSQIFIPVVQN
jgi:hypothetical protein